MLLLHCATRKQLVYMHVSCELCFFYTLQQQRAHQTQGHMEHVPWHWHCLGFNWSKHSTLLLLSLQARGFFRLDSTRSARIWEVLCAAGWLKGNKPEEAEDKRRYGPKAKKEAVQQQQQQQSMQAAAAASLAVGFPPAPSSSGTKSAATTVSAAAAAAAAAAALGLPLLAGAAGVAESGVEGMTPEVTGATNSGAVAAGGMDDDEDDDDFRP